VSPKGLFRDSKIIIIIIIIIKLFNPSHKVDCIYVARANNSDVFPFI
jgi:hypothetical protein